jgi:serine/threonine protein kinase
MHNSGVCHRDIKPENILYDPTKGKIKILDFDFSRIKKFTNSKLEMMTKTGQMSYRAPEIFNSIYD